MMIESGSMSNDVRTVPLTSLFPLIQIRTLLSLMAIFRYFLLIIGGRQEEQLDLEVEDLCCSLTQPLTSHVGHLISTHSVHHL